MATYDSAQELAEKIAWEGGAAEFIFAYGISTEDLAAIDNLPAEVVGAFMMLDVAKQFIETIDDWAASRTDGDEGE